MSSIRLTAASWRARVVCALALCIVNVPALAAPPGPDFNGDGFDDLPVRISREDVGVHVDAGAIAVFHGSAAGVNVDDDQFLTAHTAAVPGGSQPGDLFGHALAWGDFNGDGFSDLAIGMPERQFDGAASAGAVHVLYGSIEGLSAAGSQFITQGEGSAGDAPVAEDRFGSALASGDFNGDGRDDLAVAAPDEDADGRVDSGMVHVIPGSNAGLVPQSATLWRQNRPGVPDSSQTGDAFGTTLAAGDFNGDGRDDLAIGVPLEDRHGEVDTGAVTVLYGGDAGLRAQAAQLWHQDVAGIVDECQADEEFGAALAAGDFNGDSRDDLAIGAPGEIVNGHEGAGVVHVLYGGGLGLHAGNDQLFDEPGPAPQKPDEFFGKMLVAGDFNGNGFDELVITVDNNRVVSQHGGPPMTLHLCGAVYVLRGSVGGLFDTNSKRFEEGGSTQFDSQKHFGDSLLIGDFNSDLRDDLVVGVPGQRLGPAFRAGMVRVLPGTDSGLTFPGSMQLHQNSPGVHDVAEPSDGFGE